MKLSASVRAFAQIAAIHLTLAAATASRLNGRLEGGAAVVKVDITNIDLLFYQVDVEVGSNRDKVSLRLDTSTADTFVPSWETSCDIAYDPLKVDLIYNTNNSCTAYGAFYWPGSSSFLQDDSMKFNWDSGNGIWGSDVVTVAGVSIKGLSFGVLQFTEAPQGIFGIGHPQRELLYLRNKTVYENFPARLKSQGLIAKVAYLIFLNATGNGSTGSILFGGVDHAKYEGILATVPVVEYVSYSLNTYEDKSRFIVVVHDIYIGWRSHSAETEGAGQDSGSSYYDVTRSTPYPVLLDAGSPLSYFTSEVLTSFSSALGATWNSTILQYNVPCALTSNLTIVFNFSGKTIDVPYTNFVYAFDGTCVLGVLQTPPGAGNHLTLGQNFLRSVYAVFDLEDDTISIARAKYTNEEDIEAISGTIPSATQADLYSSSSYQTSFMEFSATSTFTHNLDPTFNPATRRINATMTATSSTRTVASSTSKKDGAVLSNGPGLLAMAVLLLAANWAL